MSNTARPKIVLLELFHIKHYAKGLGWVKRIGLQSELKNEMHPLL
jgi:hypothetical protein